MSSCVFNSKSLLIEPIMQLVPQVENKNKTSSFHTYVCFRTELPTNTAETSTISPRTPSTASFETNRYIYRAVIPQIRTDSASAKNSPTNFSGAYQIKSSKRSTFQRSSQTMSVQRKAAWNEQFFGANELLFLKIINLYIIKLLIIETDA